MAETLEECSRLSLVDAFEGFFGEDIERLSEASISSLPKNQLDDLVYIIDDFLKDAQKQIYPPEAVMLDSLTNPIVFPDDATEPRTTRRAKQVALSHTEVVIPMQPISIDYFRRKNKKQAARYPSALLRWTRQNHILLRQHIISVSGRPNVYDVLDENTVKQLVEELMTVFKTPEFQDVRSRIIRPEEMGTPEEMNAINAEVYSMLMDALNANSINANLAFLDEDSGMVYQKVVNSAKWLTIPDSPSITDVQVLQSLDLPAIDDLPDNEFVAIRTQSDDFEEFRDALGRVLHKTRADISGGKDLHDAFKSNLGEIHVRADMLRREVKDKAARRFLTSSFQGVSLGAITSTTAAAASDLALGASHPQALATRLFTTVGLGTLLAILFYKPSERQQRLLRFYNILLDRKPESEA